MNITPKLRKAIYITAGIVALAMIVTVMILGLQSRDKTATIEIQAVVPTDATVTIDGNKVSSNGKSGVTPGKHTVVSKRKGFEDKTQEVDAKQGENTVVRVLMTPNGQEGYDWLRSHPDQAVEYEATIGQEFNQESEAATEQNPLIAYLPEIRPTWRVDYGKSVKNPNDPKAMAIIITYSGIEIDKQNALDWIKSQGFNPDSYEIIFKTPPQPGG